MTGVPGGQPLRPRPVRATVAATAAFVVSFTPPFLVAANSVFLRRDLGFDQEGLGLAVAAYMLAFAGTTAIGGSIAERLGAGRALIACAAASATVLAAVGLAVHDFRTLVIAMIVGGAVNGVTEPATNLAMARGVVSRQGLLFGVKQSAAPMVGLLAGASVPALSSTVGWRWTFLLAAALGYVVAILIPRDLVPDGPPRLPGRRRRDGDAGLGSLLVLSAAGLLAASGANAMAAFAVEAGVAVGLAPGTAGWMLGVSSAAGIIGRLAAGRIADRWRGIELRLISGLLVAGAVGHALLATSRPGLHLLGLTVAYGLGWGYPGVLMLAIVRFNPNAPGAASGIVLTGNALGSSLGPAIFGLLATRASFTTAWIAALGATLGAAVLVLVARAGLLRDQARRADEPPG